MVTEAQRLAIFGLITDSPVRAMRMRQAGLLCIAIGLILRCAWWLALATGFLFVFLTYPSPSVRS